MQKLDHVVRCLNLGELLDTLKAGHGGYEFHHDVVLRVAETRSLPGPVLVVSTNCNGGVKEVSCFAAIPDREALWHERCPKGEFAALPLPDLLARERTVHCLPTRPARPRRSPSEVVPLRSALSAPSTSLSA